MKRLRSRDANKFALIPRCDGEGILVIRCGYNHFSHSPPVDKKNVDNTLLQWINYWLQGYFYKLRNFLVILSNVFLLSLRRCCVKYSNSTARGVLRAFRNAGSPQILRKYRNSRFRKTWSINVALSPNRWSRFCEALLRRPRRLSQLPLDAGVHRSETFILCNLGERGGNPPGLRVGPVEIVLTPGTRFMLRNNGTGTAPHGPPVRDFKSLFLRPLPFILSWYNRTPYGDQQKRKETREEFRRTSSQQIVICRWTGMTLVKKWRSG